MRVCLSIASIALGHVACGGPGKPADVTTASQRTPAVEATTIAPAAKAESRGAVLLIPCGTETQKQFDRGFALLHNMMYTQARGEFEAAAKTNEKCAMLYWGVAMTWFWPLWSGQPTEDALKAGSSAVAMAKSLSTGERERAYVDAVASYYNDWEHTKTPTRVGNWEVGQRALAARYPDDVEAQAFWALSLLAAADRYDKTYAQQLKAAALLEKLRELRPEHPGLLHYLVHAYDNPSHAEHGVRVADVYKGVAPDAPHALHMPSHIYVRLGNWRAAIDSNIKSAAAARAQPAPGGTVSRDFLHATDYLVYAYLQIGDDARAKEILAQIDPNVAYEQNSGPAAYGLAAIPARFALERFQWDVAASLPLRNIKFTWDKFPWAEAVTHAARGLGAARSGNMKAADAELVALERLKPLVESPWWRDRVELDHDVVAAWVAFKRNDKARAVELLRAAAIKEIAAGKEAVEPGHVIGAAEQFGYLLLELGRPKDALGAFETALKDSPKRFNSLFGAGEAAEAAGLREQAQKYYSELVQMSVGDSERAGYRHAKAAISPAQGK